MSTDTAVPVRHYSPLLIVTRCLAALHCLAGLLLLGYAAYAFLAYRGASDDDSLAGLGLFLGGGAAVLSGPLVALALGVLLARRPVVAYVSGVALALVVFVTGAVLSGLFIGWSAAPGSGGVVVLPSVVLLVCAVAGIARGEES